MSNQNNDFIAPIGDLLKELNDQLAIATHIEKSSAALKNTPALLASIKTIPGVSQQSDLIQSIEYLEEDTIATLKQSERILANDFSKTNSQILTSMWNSFLTSIENIQTKLLLKPQVRIDIVDSGTIGNRWKMQLVNETNEEELRFFLKGWKTSGNNIVEYIESKWSHFDFSAPVSDGLKTDLIEMHQLRNCLVHRGGIVDYKTVNEAPSLTFDVGQTLSITKKMLLKYHKAVGDYAVSMLARIPKCKHTYIKNQS